ncbi:hypothetical protein ACPW96_18270 [Micromonospora sp. DT81.3]|uniref:hypothetical protein n=1 Tax=Micromonospora sp. DT81.3 TaxID=3416523 RepID=UPI003CE950AB
MLIAKRGRLAALFALFALIGGLLFAVAPAADAADGTWCDQNDNCWVLASAPGSDPPFNPDPETGFTPGTPYCTFTQLWGVRATVEVPCTTAPGRNYWSHRYQCYVALAGVQGGVPSWAGNPDGAWYWCDDGVPDTLRCAPADPLGCRGGYSASFWSDYPPPGLYVLTPRQAAMKLIKTFALEGIEIGMAPEVNPEWGHRRGYVGVPIWLWVNNPQPLTWGPYSETATIGMQTITATARVTSVIWNMGEGGSTVCGNVGTPYSVGYGMTASPTCGYRYSSTSERAAGDRFTVTATSQWTVDWAAATGQTGTINLTTDSAVDLEVNELQTVIVP